MCHYKTISNNSFGCLIQCKNCEQFHLGFGNVVLVLSYDEFIRLTDQVHNIHSMHYEEKKENNEKIYMHTDNTRMILAFTPKEWIQLYQLLEESRFMLYANELIDQD
ncbi:DUF6686 family protein [Fluviicola sp.]|uniref:DUF6686 family protein n=1 Tax=Fluviicola sp. TaxID=1917219 RepID=UPI002636D37B|nr:DUF6686 family protein [Fluviicola sp.]